MKFKARGYALTCALLIGSIFRLSIAGGYTEAPDLRKPGTAQIADKASSSNAQTDKPSKLARYKLDATQSLVKVRVFVGGILATFGHDHTISVSGLRGEVQMTPITIEPAA